MAASTGPILAIGAVTVANDVLFHRRSIDWRVPIATCGAAILFGFLEKPLGPVAAALAWASLVTSLFVPAKGDKDPPITAAAKYFTQG
ncbi:MAG: hypothetical protein V4515_14815 [Chloroflexota bacterium]